MPAGNTPWTSVANRNVTVSWTAVTMPGGTPVDGYKVFRYDAGGAAFPVGGSCAGVVPGLTCNETAMAPGSWSYAVAPVYELWQGAEGPRSAAAMVAAPALSLTGSTDITSVPGTLNGTVSNYVPGQTLTMRLDDPASGQILPATVTPNSIPVNGNAALQVTVPSSVVDGAHTLYAAGGGGDIASAAFTVAAPTPSPTSLTTANGGGNGGARKIGTGDTVAVAFSSPLKVSTMCSTWSGDGSNQNAAGTVHVDDNAASGNDRLRLTTTAPVCGGAFKFGQIDLGNNGFVTAGTTFTASLAWNASQSTLTITVLNDSTDSKKVNSPATAVYTPDAAMTGTSGRAVVGTVSATAFHF